MGQNLSVYGHRFVYTQKPLYCRLVFRKNIKAPLLISAGIRAVLYLDERLRDWRSVMCLDGTNMEVLYIHKLTWCLALKRVILSAVNLDGTTFLLRRYGVSHST